METSSDIAELLELIQRTLVALEGASSARDVADDAWRTAARRDVARLVAAGMRDRDGPWRAIAAPLAHLIEIPYAEQRLRAFKRDVEWTQAAVVRPRPADARVLRAGSGTADFQQVIPLTETRTLGLLGSTLTGQAENVVVGALLAGALAVAVRGMRASLDASAALTVLDRALKDAMPTAAPVAMLAWSFDRATRELRVASAGHRGLWLVRSGTFVAIRPPKGDALGTATQLHKYVTEPLHRGDLLFSFTSGLLDQPGADGSMLREKDLRYGLLDVPTTLQGVYDSVRQVLLDHCSPEDWQVEGTALLWECP